MRPLPKIMVAPNGARRGKADHPALPITDDEVIEVAIASQAAGADGIHIHIRDEAGQHLIDAERYRALLDRLKVEVPEMYLQVTSETAGKYEASEQQDMVRALQPDYVSVGLREMVRQPADWPAARDFYHWARAAGVEIQHILYSPEDVLNFVHAVSNGRIPGQDHLVLFVQGTYANGSQDSVDLEEYLSPLATMDGFDFDWMVCAFGAQETNSLVRAAELGGKARVGFENSLQNADGSQAKDNAERVREVSAAILGL
ncbi:3-keto-5-aminohexanoate cleavage protein [Octadecabacter sp. 1_MG-2023]|uniref:3-keto-5-aminohexanoate cleavage protein n=1 Tax=unclassified Octadecabacter TaxID=196158 RepID=UPI001C09CC0B|nr:MULTISPECIES: 3-keto-5-aminohexanoate cleavage protein [unclassified Octadecabacter]MBU2991704.1 3-keto-5-aminohexanoate cleavage protein [Octadecabacter sp. B2R22]MDO6735677.1 3-keto-5-aminohexanoate cleavage protein [Octadecabacter sp. 1_MG-2023]